MGRVLTNSTGLLVTNESSTGVLPAAPTWYMVEFETIGAFGATITTVTRRPIGSGRGRKKGTVTDLESAVEIETDLTMDVLARFIEGFFFSEFANAEFDLKLTTASIPAPPPAVSGTDDFTIDAASALLAGKVVYTVGQGISLVYAKGYTNAANNGLHALNVDLASTDTTLQVASTLVTETPPTNASLQVCGVRVSDGDLTLTKSGSTATLVSAADIADWSTLGLRAGMYIHIGSADTSGVVQNALQDTTGGAADDTYGYARITSISTVTLNLAKLDTNIGDTADNTGTGVADIMFGRWVRDVVTTADADDTRYLERTYQFEIAYPELTAGSTDYEYSSGNFANEMTLNVPLTDKSTLGISFTGTTSDEIVVAGSRKTNAADAVDVLRTTAFNTSSDLVSITTDVVSLAADVCFKSLTITILNNVSPEKCLGTLGATFVNAGIFQFDMEGQMLFTNRQIVNAIRDNTTVTFAAILRNDDGAVAIDVPAMTMGGGGREFPIDQSVLANITGSSFTGTAYNFNASMTLFAFVPYA